MLDVPEPQPPARLRLVLSLVALAFVAGAWTAEGAGRQAVSHLDLSKFGRCEDVQEALVRDGHTARRYCPYIASAALLDGLAVIVLLHAATPGRHRLTVLVTVGVVGFASFAWHGLGLFITVLFTPSGGITGEPPEAEPLSWPTDLN